MNSSVETPVYAVVQTAKVEFASPPAFPVWKPIFPHPKLSPAENLLLLSPKLGTGGIVTNGAGFSAFSFLPFPHLLASASSHSLSPPLLFFISRIWVKAEICIQVRTYEQWKRGSVDRK